jgi:hypothetical protein
MAKFKFHVLSYFLLSILSITANAEFTLDPARMHFADEWGKKYDTNMYLTIDKDFKILTNDQAMRMSYFIIGESKKVDFDKDIESHELGSIPGTNRCIVKIYGDRDDKPHPSSISSIHEELGDTIPAGSKFQVTFYFKGPTSEGSYGKIYLKSVNLSKVLLGKISCVSDSIFKRLTMKRINSYLGEMAHIEEE